MTNLDKFRAEITPDKLADMCFCPYCPAHELCSNIYGYKMCCRDVVKQWCEMEAK